MSQLQPVAVEQGNMTVVPKLKRLVLDNTGKQSSITIEWCKKIVETGDEIPQSNMEISSTLMDMFFPDGFVRYSPITGAPVVGYPPISQQELMIMVYSIFKNMITTDMTLPDDIDVPDDELMVE